MADIKFRCPECTQKIAVAESAAGVKIDCPTCHSRLVIPRSVLLPVEVLIKRKLAIVGGSADAVYAELQKAEVRAEKAADEIKQLRAENAAAGQKSREENAGLLVARGALQSELESLRPLREQLAKAQHELASASEHEAQFIAMRDTAVALRTELSALRATHDGTQDRISTLTGQLGVLQGENVALAQNAAEATELREQLATARKDAARAQASAEITVDAHRAQLDAAKGIEAGVRAELAAVQTRHTQAEERLAEQAAKFATLEAEHAELATFVEELAPLREELTKAQTDLCNLCESAAEKARGYESQIETAKTSEAEARARLDEWQSKHASAQNQIAEQSARLAEQSARFAEMEKRAAEFQAEAAAAKTQDANLASAQEELTRALQQAAQHATERDDAAKKIEEILASADASESAFRAHSGALKAKVEDAERRHAAISHGFTALKQERGDLTTELNTLRKERDDAAAKLADHSKTIEKLTPALDSAKGELARLREETNGAAVEKGRSAAALEKTSAERAELLGRCKQLEAAATASGKEIARLKQLSESAEAGAKSGGTKLQQLAARAESLSALVAEKEAATRDALAKAEQHRTEQLATQERAQKAERSAAEAAERAGKGESEKTALTAELSRKSAELDASKSEAARAQAALDQIKAQPKETRADSASPTEREKSLEAERDALATALERAKQHVGVLQARRDMLRDEVATLRSRLGIGGKVTSGDEKPIAK